MENLIKIHKIMQIFKFLPSTYIYWHVIFKYIKPFACLLKDLICTRHEIIKNELV